MAEVTYIGLDARCAECGKRATRVNPDDGLPGCATCYPHWPAMSAAHNADRTDPTGAAAGGEGAGDE